jgi:hypothetical protein
VAVDPKTGLTIFGPINELTTATYTAKLVNEGGASLTSLNSLDLTIFDLSSNIEILSKTSVLSSFDVGTLSVTIAATSNKIINQRRNFEDHIARFDFTYNSGNSSGHHAVLIRVRNLGGIH